MRGYFIMSAEINSLNSPTDQSQDEYETSPNHVVGIMSDKWQQLRSEEYFDYRKSWDEVPATKTELDFPIHLDIETTTRCNLLCPMCPRTIQVNDGVFNDYGFMTREEYASIIDQGVTNGVKAIKLNYLGEPLVHKDVVWQVEYAKQKGILDVMMNSNGSALTEKNARALLEAGLDNMFISFDAVNPADYETQRVGTTIGRVIDNIYNFSKLRDEIRPECQLRLSMVIYDDPKWMRQYEAMKVMWEGLVDAVNYNKLVERTPELIEKQPINPDFHCAMVYQRMFLKNNGNVTICCFDDRDQVVVGNWREESLHSIWNNKAYKKIREMHSTGNYHKIKMCRTCPISTMSNK